MDSRRTALCLVCVMSILWALQITVSKLALNAGAHPLAFLFQMLSVAAVFIACSTLAFSRAGLHAVRRKDLVPLVSIAVVGSVCANIAGYVGLENSSSVNYGFLIKSALVFTAILAYWFLGEGMTHRKGVLITGLITGLYLVTTRGKGIVPSPYDGLIILGAFFYAVSNILAKSVVTGVHPQVIAFFRTCCGAVLLGIVLVCAGVPAFSVIRPDLVMATGLFLAGMQSVMYRALRLTSVCYLSMMSMMTPVLVAVIGILFLGETFSIVQAVGGAIILLCGVSLSLKEC